MAQNRQQLVKALAMRKVSAAQPNYRGSVIPGNSRRGKRIRQAHKLGPRIKPWLGGGDTGA